MTFLYDHTTLKFCFSCLVMPNNISETMGNCHQLLHVSTVIISDLSLAVSHTTHLICTPSKYETGKWIGLQDGGHPGLFTAHAPCKPHHYKWFSAVSSTNITWMISFISLKLAYPELPSLHTQSWCEVVLKTWHICRPDLILPSTLSKGNSKEFRLGGAHRLITYLCAGGAWGDAAVFKLSSRDMMEIS